MKRTPLIAAACTIVMPTRKIEDDTLVAASGAKEK